MVASRQYKLHLFNQLSIAKSPFRLQTSLIITVLSLLVAGCYRGLDRDLVRGTIEREVAWGETFFFADIGRVGYCGDIKSSPITPTVLDEDPGKIELVAAEKAGLISITASGKRNWKTELTEAGRVLAKSFNSYTHQNGCNYETVRFPVAMRTLVEVSAINGNNERTVAEYKWKWRTLDLAFKLKSVLSLNQVLQMDTHLNDIPWLPENKFSIFTPNKTETATSKMVFRKVNGQWRVSDEKDGSR